MTCRPNWPTRRRGAASPTRAGPDHLLGKPLADIERWAIVETLKLTNGNREEAAKILGISPRTLYRRLDEYEGRLAANRRQPEASERVGSGRHA